MHLKDLQEKVAKRAVEYGQENNIKIDKEFALTKLYEEVGELSQAILIHDNKCRTEKRVSEDVAKKALSDELADVICMTLINADLLGIDIETAIDKKWIHREK